MRRSKEEIFLEKMQKAEQREIRLAEREKRKAEKLALKAERSKEEPTEEELVRRYVNRTIKNQIYHGRIDREKFQGMEQRSVSKNNWMDTDFFFSVVFQSQSQKMEFFAKLGWPVESFEQCQIVNGLKLAETLGVKLKLEDIKDYPTGNLDLMEFVLDNEQLGENNG